MTITLPAGARQGDGRQKIAVEGERDKIGGAEAPVRGRPIIGRISVARAGRGAGDGRRD